MKSALENKDLQLLWHPYTQMQKSTRHPVIVKGEGAYLICERGERYFDGSSSWWVNLHGHAHPYISKRIKEQLDLLEQVIFADFTHPKAVELAERLLPLLPGKMERIFFSDNGSTAVEVAIKMALQMTRKKRLISFKGAYHGDTFGAMSAAGPNYFNQKFRDHLFEVTTIDPPEFGKEELSIKQLVSAIDGGDTAAFIFEPLVQGARGMVTHSKEGLKEMMRICKMRSILLIADEVMTGFGRLGPLFATEESPDLIALSKGLTGGFLPLGVTACSIEVFSAFLGDSLDEAFLHGHSFTANPLACASAVASLDLLESMSCKSMREEIQKSHQAFVQTYRHHPLFKRIESMGTLLILELETSSKIAEIKKILFQKKIHLRPLGNVLYLLPPYCTKKEELQSIYSEILSTMESIYGMA